MKKAIRFLFIIISLSFFISKKSSAQEYLPTALEESRRIVANYYQDPEYVPIPEMISQWEYKCTNDTIINDTLYKKVYKRNLKINTYPYEPISEYILFRFIRDDIENKKVYVRSLAGGPEVLLYDFSLAAGDYVSLPITDYDVDFVVDVYPGSAFGSQSNYFDFAAGYYYMEGIGSNCGFLEIMTSVLKKKNRDISFTALENYCLSGDCESVFVSAEEILNTPKKLHVYPQPATDFVHFTLNDAEISKIKIYNLNGELIEEIEGVSTIHWNCKNIVSGVYFYKGFSPNNFYSGKILIQ
jgi:hypothetical protein